MAEKSEPSADEMVCLQDSIRVHKKPEGSRTWGKGEDDDDKGWVHSAARNYLGNQDCGRRALRDDEVGPYASAE